LEERSLNEFNSKRVWNAIRNGGDYLTGKLPPSSRHPKGRNPYAHIAKCIKSKYKCSYKEILDEKVDEVMDFIDYLVENPF
jgi:hypothetical protein|tara:strand:- start:1152 stop:1394 length:243 start_codon:yes stop_codon:yes gene_type:complete